MAVKDNVSDIRASQNDTIAVSADGTVAGNAVDTADYELGLTFVAFTTAYTDGTHVLGAQESDDDGATDPYTAVSADKLIIPVAGDNSAAAAVNEGDACIKVGVFSNKRYVKPIITSTGVTTGATFSVMDIQKTEYGPDQA